MPWDLTLGVHKPHLHIIWNYRKQKLLAKFFTWIKTSKCIERIWSPPAATGWCIPSSGSTSDILWDTVKLRFHMGYSAQLLLSCNFSVNHLQSLDTSCSQWQPCIRTLWFYCALAYILQEMSFCRKLPWAQLMAVGPTCCWVYMFYLHYHDIDTQSFHDI